MKPSTFLIMLAAHWAIVGVILLATGGKPHHYGVCGVCGTLISVLAFAVACGEAGYFNGVKKTPYKSLE